MVRLTSVVALLSVSIVFGLAPAWSAGPSCAAIGGLPSLSSTSDDGATYVPNNRPLSAGTGTFGIAAAGGGLVAEYMGRVYGSADGCHWSPLGNVDTTPLRFAPGAGSVVWGWSLFQAPGIWRVDPAASGTARVARMADLPAAVLTVAADPTDGMHVRAVGTNGQIYDSIDGGGRWSAVGRRAPVGGLVYFAAVHATDLDRAMIGVVTQGVYTTLDGGASWQQATGLSETNGPVNGFNGLYAPSDPGVAYVQGIDLDQNLAHHPSDGRHVYRSDDGGLSFEPVVDQGNGIVLTNGPALAAHPFDSDVLYFPFGSRFAGGVTLYRYDHATGAVTSGMSPDWTIARVLAIHPASPDVVQVGFEREGGP